MKYRILTIDELTQLEEELKQFLIVNGIHDKEWLEMNSNEPQKAIELVEMFSDLVLDKVYQKIEFLEFRSTDNCLVFHFEKDSIELISIQLKEESTLDLSTVESIHAAIVNSSDDIIFFQTNKPYSSDKGFEVHQMLEQGCVLSSVEFWNALKICIG